MMFGFLSNAVGRISAVAFNIGVCEFFPRDNWAHFWLHVLDRRRNFLPNDDDRFAISAIKFRY